MSDEKSAFRMLKNVSAFSCDSEIVREWTVEALTKRLIDMQRFCLEISQILELWAFDNIISFNLSTLKGGGLINFSCSSGK